MRLRVFAVAMVFAAVPLAASPAHAQFDSERRLTITGGPAIGPAADLYNGWIRLDLPASGEAAVDRRLDTKYRERMDAPVGAFGRALLSIDDSKFIALAGVLGRSSSSAEYSGEAAAESFERDVAWRSLEATGGLVLARSGRLEIAAEAGLTWTGWELNTHGTGRNVLVARATAGRRERIDWGDRSWSALGFLASAEARLRLLPGLDLGLSARQYLLPTPAHVLAEADKADIRSAGGSTELLRYESHLAHPTLFSLTLSWTPLRIRSVDPGRRALAAWRERPDTAAGPAAAPARAVDWPAGVGEALARGDTAAALARLEALAAASQDDARAVGQLGVLLAEAAPWEETAFEERMRARALLERALQLDPGNPHYLSAIGTVLHKQARWNDATRVLSRAIGAAAEQADGPNAALLADAFFRRANSLESWVYDFENLKSLATRTPPVTAPDCPDAFCWNWEHPRSFYDWFEELPRLDRSVEGQREAMLEDYRRAVEVMPSHPGANRGLLRAAARADDWDRFFDLARGYAAAAPDDGWGLALLGTGAHWTGRGGEADSAFARALELLSPADHAIFEDLRPLLRTAFEPVWDAMPEGAREYERLAHWFASDPLYLTPANERRSEHYARVALAELLFGEPQAGRRGWETDRGDILVRYGRPPNVWQVASGGRTGGRLIFWNYAREQPSFIFSKTLGRSSTRHMIASQSATVAEEAKKNYPTTFTPPFEDAGEIAHQIARFRGVAAGTHEVEIYTRAPAERLAAGGADSIVHGLFLRRKGALAAAVEQRQSVVSDNAEQHYRLTMPPGLFAYSLEAASTDYSAAAVSRGELRVGAYTPSKLALSDLLIVRDVAARTVSPAHRRDLTYEPVACLAVPNDRKLSIIFEAYGLTPGDDGMVSYGVEIESGRAPPRNLAVKLLRGARDVIRGQPGGTLSYRRVAEPAGDRVIEWLELELPEDLGEEQELVVQLTDETTGQTARAERVLGVDGCRQ